VTPGRAFHGMRPEHDPAAPRVETVLAVDPGGDSRDPHGFVGARVIRATHLTCLPKPTRYEVVVVRRARLPVPAAVALAAKLRDSLGADTVVADCGGVGRGFVDDLRLVHGVACHAVHFVGGDSSRTRPGRRRGLGDEHSLGKGLAHRHLDAVIGSSRVRLPAGPATDELIRELLDLRRRWSPSGVERIVVEAGPDAGHHGDLASALSLVTWWGEKPPRGRVQIVDHDLLSR